MDNLIDSNTFHKHMLLGCMTCHSAHSGLIVVYKLSRNVLTGIHQQSPRRTIEVAWLPLDATMKRKERQKGKFWDIVKPSRHCHNQHDLVRHWCSEHSRDGEGPTSMHTPQRAECTLVVFQTSTTRSCQRRQPRDESAHLSRSEAP